MSVVNGRTFVDEIKSLPDLVKQVLAKEKGKADRRSG